MNKRGDSNKACSWEFFLKKNKKNSMLIRDFRVIEPKIAIANPSCDNEVLRDYFLKLIRKFVFSALDEIYSFKTEKEILAHMAQMREQSGGASAVVAVQRPKIRYVYHNCKYPKKSDDIFCV